MIVRRFLPLALLALLLILALPVLAQDQDGDGMPDTYELSHPCLNPLVNDANGDPDGDQEINLNEYQWGEDPCVFNDSDGDGMPNAWELRYSYCGLNPSVDDAGADADFDYLTNLQEWLSHTNPCVSDLDSDDDGMPDHYEVLYPCLDPYTADAGLDPDADGLNNFAEYQFGTDPCNFDTDGDGMDDGWETQYPCLNPLMNDAKGNPDTDALSNLQEYMRGSNPCVCGNRGRVCIVVPASLEPGISASLAQYQHDLEQARFSVIYDHYTTETPQQLRAMLAQLYGEFDSLAGAVLIGNVPYVQFHDTDTFPTDLYYMDLDGVWGDINGDGIYDSHQGDRALEIWVSRMKADNLPLIGTDQAAILNRYFDKAHRYRTGKLAPADQALLYLDGALTCAVNVDVSPYVTALEGIYGPGSVTVEENQTGAYFTGTLMARNYAFVISASHSSSTSMGIRHCTPGTCSCTSTSVGGADFLAHDPPWFFYIMGGCGAGNYNVTNYLAGVETFNPADSGLFTVGSTRPAGLTAGDIRFFQEYTTVGPMGMMYLTWFNGLIADSPSGGGLAYYGAVMNGDAALQLRMSHEDYDHDGLRNDYEQAHPCLDAETPDRDLDPDGDGLTNGQESTAGADPCSWDSDGDHLPDGYEIGHGLNPLAAADGVADTDGDGNSNVNEYWNGSDSWTPDPAPGRYDNPGCFYWGDGDGDGVPSPVDVAKLKMEIAGIGQNYDAILPHTAETLDLDRDGTRSPLDLALLLSMVAGAEMVSGYPSQAAGLELVSAPTGSVAVGSTAHVTVSVHSASGEVPYAPGFGVVFEVMSGNGVLLGGDGTADGEAAGNRFDVSMEVASGAKANMVVLVTGAGPITIGAKAPGCGVYPFGRWNDEVILSPSVVINP